MVTKGLIKSIDYNSNTCKVRLPLFENASQPSEVCVTAIFAIQPGSINGYKENDVVIVAFDGGSVSSPIVIGKLYLGAAEEAKESRGAIKCDSLSVASEATLPLTTKLISGNFGTNTIDIDGGASSYTSLLDLVKALQKTEENFTKSSIDLDAQIAEIVIEYVSVSVDTTVTNDTELTWQSAIPDWRDGYNIWQKTTYLNRRGQILSTPEIVCLSELTTIASYWLKCSARSHNGSQQNSEITITAMIKLGSNLETDDTGATLEYRWSDGSTKQPEVENPDKPYELKFINTNEAPFPNADLIITAKRNGVEYESETISFMPLNTPILILSNESDWIEYDSYGINKINQNASVESTAKVMLNNEVLPVKSITWEANNSECTITPTDDINSDNRYLSSTVKVSDIEDAVDTTYVTCTAIYVNNLGENNTTTLTKRFSVAKNKAGKSAYEVVIENDFVSIPATSDGTMTDFNWTLTKHKVTALYGDKILACTCSDGDGATTQDVHLKYTLSDGITLANTPSASESKTPREIQVASLSGKTGSITYELFKKGTKVASSKFEIIRVDAGEPSTSYSLICSHSNINIAANGTISPNVILVGVSKKRGNEAITRINTDNLPLTRDSAKDLYLRVKIVNTYQYRLETNDEKTDYKISTASVYKNTPITIELVLKGNTSADDIIIDRETISAVEDGKGGDSIRVYQAFCWTDDYLVNVIAPNNTHTELATTLGNKNIWATLENAPTRENMNSSKADWKLVYLSSCTETIPGEGSSTEASISAWTAPEVFLCKDPEAYRILTTVEGLFGYGQGVYYTPTANNTVEKPKNNPTDPTTYYSVGEVVSQSYAAEWVAGDPNTRKDDLELYINAEYIKTGSFTVGDTNNPLFQAGLDTGTNKTPIVKIAGFDVNSNGIYSSDYKDHNGNIITSFNNNNNNWNLSDSSEGVYIGTDGIRLGKNFSVDTNGEVIARSLKIGNTKDSKTADLGAEITADGKIKATNLEVESAQITDLVTDQLEVLTTDSEGNKHPILLVNAEVDSTGKTVRSEGNVQISGFEVHSSNLNNITDDGYISIGTNGIVLGKSEDSEEPPFMVKADGELTATKGTFNGSITASGSALQDNKSFSMSMEEDSEATFDKISARGSISTTSDINSLGGYFFGTDNSCGFKLVGASTTTTQEVELKISTIAPTLIETTKSRYCYYAIIIHLVKKGTTTRVNAAKDIQVTYTGATWSNDLTTVTIPGKTITIKAGSSSYTDGKTVANMSNFSDLKYELIRTYDLGTRAAVGGGGLSGLKMPTGTPSPAPSITTPSNLTFTQNVISNANNIELNCNTFKMNGSISMTGNVTVPSTGAFYVKNSSNETVVTLNSSGLTTDGTVKFKVGDDYYEPVIRLNEGGSPNCFWSCEKAFTENTAKSWIRVNYPVELIGKIVSVVAMARYPAWVPKGGKNSNGELIESDPTVDNRFYVDWSDTTNEIYAYNGTSYESGGSLSIFVAAKI